MVHCVLKLISPVTSEKETETLLGRVMGHAPEFLGHSQDILKDPALPQVIVHQFSLGFYSPAEAPQFKDELWADVLGGKLGQIFALSFVPKAVAETKKRLAVFDMDSTMINQEVIDELARTFGLYEKIAEITEQAMQGHLDFKESLLKRCQLLTGMAFKEAASIIPALTVSPGGEALVKHLRSSGIRTGIVSGGFEFVLKHFQAQLGVDEVHGHHLLRDENDVLTGKVDEPIIDAEYKRTLVARMKRDHGYKLEETITVGDGANDIQMMKEAGVSVSFCGKPKLSMTVNTLILQRNLLWLKHLI